MNPREIRCEPKTSESKKKEYARLFPWMAQFAHDKRFANLGWIRVAPPLSVKDVMSESSSVSNLFALVSADGTILKKVGYVKNPKSQNWFQKTFPNINPYDEELRIPETLYTAIRDFPPTDIKYIVTVEYVSYSHPETVLVLYRVPRGYASFAEYFAEVLREEEQVRHANEAAARAEIEAELNQ